MRTIQAVAILMVALAVNLQAGEIPAKSRITAVGLFKSGLAVVEREVRAPATGTYRLDDVPEPVHGTFWIESDAKIEARITRREVKESLQVGGGMNFQEELVGTQVTIHFRDGKIPPASGKVVRIEPGTGAGVWGRTYQQQNYYYGSRYRTLQQSASQGRFLILETGKGRIYVESSMIAYLATDESTRTVTRNKPVLLLAAQTLDRKPAVVRITYLAKGMAWAPSYRVDISDPKMLTIAQKAVIKNELGDIDDAQVTLISGFPSVEFSHVTSPLSLRTNWATFFSQLSQRFHAGHASTRNRVAYQSVVSNVREPGGLDISAAPAGEGVDLHYEPLGKRSLAEGDSLLVNIASAKAEYERIVEWLVPDTRSVDGRHIQQYQREREPDKFQGAVWDALRFRNPFAFPMTTAPAMVVSGKRFNGQRMSFWVNTGEQTTLRVTKALSIRTRSTEHEEKGKREIVYVGGDDFRKTSVQGELSVSNHRNEAVTLVIRRRFSGDLLEADGKPKCILREDGVYSVNKRNELFWSLSLKPGEEKKLTYRYSVLVNN